MKILFSLLAEVCLLSAFFMHAVNAADRPPGSMIRVAIVPVEIDASGKIVAFELPKDLNHNQALSLRNHFLNFTLDPAQKDGKNVSSSTHLMIHYYSVIESGKNDSLKIISTDSGPRAMRQSGLRYPRAGITRRHQSLILVQATIRPDGKPGNVQVAMQWPASKPLSRTAVNAVRRWKFEPDKVDGVAIVSDVLIPIQFCIEHCLPTLTPDLIHQLISNAPPTSQVHQSYAQNLPLLPLIQVITSNISEGVGKTRRESGRERFRKSR